MDKKEKENKTRDFRLRLTQQERENLEYLAKVKGKSMSKIVAEFIEKEAGEERFKALVNGNYILKS